MCIRASISVKRVCDATSNAFEQDKEGERDRDAAKQIDSDGAGVLSIDHLKQLSSR